jgi:serine/threonine protein kinase
MKTGDSVSHYRILEPLGAGGMGVVYKAEDTRLKRLVALKFLPVALGQDPEAKERLIQEAQAASALDHPNICTIYEIDETEDGQLFLAMACYDGPTSASATARACRPSPWRSSIDSKPPSSGLAVFRRYGSLPRSTKSTSRRVCGRRSSC